MPSERIAFDQDGFPDTLDPDLIDYRCAFKWGYTLITDPVDGTAFFELPFEETYELFRRVDQIRIEYDIQDATTSDGVSGNELVTPALGITSLTERGRVCATGIGASVTDPSAGFNEVGFQLSRYIPGEPGDPGRFSFTVLIVGSQWSTGDIGGGIAFYADFFGEMVPVYQAPGHSVSGFVTVTRETWFAYDNGTGPIWDVINGQQLIDPVPFGL